MFTIGIQPTSNVETCGSKVFRIAALRHMSTDCLPEVVESFGNEVRLQAQLGCHMLYSFLTCSIQPQDTVIILVTVTYILI